MKLLVTTLMLTICMACTQQDDVEIMNEALITGHCIDNGKEESRSTVSELKNGALISFYASKGIDADGLVLSYTDGYWRGDTPIYWNHQHEQADVCAYNPPLPDTTDELYSDNGLLTDLLIAQQSYPSGTTIRLHFEHLFTQIDFTVEPQLNTQLKQLVLIPKQLIAAISPASGTITTMPNTRQLKALYSPQATGIYSFLLPPATNQEIAIQLETADGRKLHKTLSPLDCKRNRRYTCHIKEKSTTIGIETAEDFIAFTHLINGFSYEGHSLKEFGKTQQGITTYYLNNDICFTEEQKSRLQQIGTQGFDAIFDGQGHTLSNVNIIEGRTQTPGLFTEITANGIVRNLHLQHFYSALKGTGGSTGALCGKNKGLILNCSVKDSEINTLKNKIGGIAGQNLGTIINCAVDHFTITANSQTKNPIQFGGISSFNGTGGKILNCYVSRLEAKQIKTSQRFLSCITHQNSSIVSNCVSNRCTTQFHPFCKTCSHPCDHCYYHHSMLDKAQETEGMTHEQQRNNHIDYLTKSTPIELNNWIDHEGKSHYSQYTFHRWKLNPDNTITFEKQ